MKSLIGQNGLFLRDISPDTFLILYENAALTKAEVFPLTGVNLRFDLNLVITGEIGSLYYWSGFDY